MIGERCAASFLLHLRRSASSSLPRARSPSSLRASSLLYVACPILAFRPVNKQHLEAAILQWHVNSSLADEANGAMQFWDTSLIDDMSYLFHSSPDFNEPIGTWNTAKVASMQGMFGGAERFNQPIGHWNTAAVTNVAKLLQNASSFNQPIGSWSTARVTSMQGLFSGAGAFDQPIGMWNTLEVTDMADMFAHTEKFDQPLDSWITAKVFNTTRMFYNASSFNQPIGSWSTAHAISMQSMFKSAAAFNQPVATWNTARVASMASMMEDAASFNQAVGSWNTAHVESMRGMFCRARDFNQPIGAWSTARVVDMANMFSSAVKFNQAIGTWVTAHVKNMRYMFSGAQDFNQPLGAWITANVTSMTRMLQNAVKFNQAIAPWNTAKVIDMAELFLHAAKFNQPIGAWDTRSVINMASMFDDAQKFNQPIEDWSTGRAVNMARMFRRASAFNQPIGQWDVSNVSNMLDIFRGASQLCHSIRSWNGFPCYGQASASWNERSASCQSSMPPIDRHRGIPIIPSDGHGYVTGLLALVVNHAYSFCNNKHVREALVQAVADLADVLRSWVHAVTVNCKPQRILPLDAIYQGVEDVDVSWEIRIPANTLSNRSVHAIVYEFNSKSREEAMQTVKAALDAGYYAGFYNVSVASKFAEVKFDTLKPASALNEAASSDGDAWLIILAVVGNLFVLFALLLGFVVHKHRNVIKNAGRKRKRSATMEELRELSGSVAMCTFEELLHPPSAISELQAYDLRELARALLDVNDHNAPVFMTFATDRRPEDAEDSGPGMFFAAAVTRLLHEHGIQCMSHLALPKGMPREVLVAQMAVRHTHCEVLIVLQTKALYHCLDCLSEIYQAQRSHIKIFPLRFEHDLVARHQEWPQVGATDVEYMLKLTTVLDGFCKMNSIPSPPHTVVGQPDVIHDVLTDLKRQLRTLPDFPASLAPTVVGMTSASLPSRDGLNAYGLQHAAHNGASEANAPAKFGSPGVLIPRTPAAPLAANDIGIARVASKRKPSFAKNPSAKTFTNGEDPQKSQLQPPPNDMPQRCTPSRLKTPQRPVIIEGLESSVQVGLHTSMPVSPTAFDGSSRRSTHQRKRVGHGDPCTKQRVLGCESGTPGFVECSPSSVPRRVLVNRRSSLQSRKFVRKTRTQRNLGGGCESQPICDDESQACKSQQVCHVQPVGTSSRPLCIMQSEPKKSTRMIEESGMSSRPLCILQSEPQKSAKKIEYLETRSKQKKAKTRIRRLECDHLAPATKIELPAVVSTELCSANMNDFSSSSLSPSGPITRKTKLKVPTVERRKIANHNSSAASKVQGKKVRKFITA